MGVAKFEVSRKDTRSTGLPPDLLISRISPHGDVAPRRKNSNGDSAGPARGLSNVAHSLTGPHRIKLVGCGNDIAPNTGAVELVRCEAQFSPSDPTTVLGLSHVSASCALPLQPNSA